MTLSEQAIQIVKEVKEATGLEIDVLGRLLDAPSYVIHHCLNNPEFELGTVTARKIIRAKITYDNYLKRKAALESFERTLAPEEKYKGKKDQSKNVDTFHKTGRG